MFESDDLCECGHVRSDHCLDDECCVFARDEYGGACLVHTCQCSQFKQRSNDDQNRKDGR